jgi:ParE toxin of type II toxin-antitoxin system, parDE
MIVRWTQPAADDLLHICDYTAERFGASQARRAADAIFETATSLQDMPNRGRKGRKPNTRKCLSPASPSPLFTGWDKKRSRSPVSCILRSNGLNHHEGAKDPLLT